MRGVKGWKGWGGERGRRDGRQDSGPRGRFQAPGDSKVRRWPDGD